MCGGIQALNDGKKGSKENQQEKDEEVWATSKTNIHQPVYTPGFGPYHAYSPLFLTPPPPQVAVSNLIPPSPVFLPSQRKIKKQINVVNYPQHLDNPTNYFSMPRIYNPFFGSQHPMNLNHPFNFLHGPAPFPSYGSPNYVPGFASLAELPSSMGIGMQNTSSNGQNSESLSQGSPAAFQPFNGQFQGINSMAAPMQQFGFSNANTLGYDPFKTDFGEGGAQSPYNMIPGAGGSRLLQDIESNSNDFDALMPQQLDFDEMDVSDKPVKKSSTKKQRTSDKNNMI